LDEQEEMAREFGLTIDRQGYSEEMEKQRSRARASWKGADKAFIPDEYRSAEPTEFIGREALEAVVTVRQVIGENGTTSLIFDKTPFYAEAGGQVGDTGLLLSPESGERVAIVENTQKPAPNAVAHRVHLFAEVKPGDRLLAKVDQPRRE